MLLGARLFTNMSPIYDPKWINIPYMEHMIWDSFKYVNIIYIYMFQIVQILSSYSTDIDRYSIYDMPISFSESLDASLLQDAYIILHMGVPQNGLHPKNAI